MSTKKQGDIIRKCKKCEVEKPIEAFELLAGYRKRTCRECRNKRQCELYAKNDAMKAARKSYMRLQYTDHRNRVFDHYGRQCACCGESEPLFLSVDHVNNDGHLQRRSPGKTSHNNIYGWLVRNGFPDGFQILCSNCNHGKHRNGGVCPHIQKVQRLELRLVPSSDGKRSARS